VDGERAEPEAVVLQQVWYLELGWHEPHRSGLLPDAGGG
jgi:hypothetical protein